MKKIIYPLVVIINIFFFSSCEDFLREDPKGDIAPHQFYQSDAEAHAGAIGVYRDLAHRFGTDEGQASFNSLTLYGTDIAHITGGRENQMSWHIYTLSSANEADMPTFWRILYRGVANACNLIEQVSASGGVSENVKKQIVAEGKLYLALYYYYLTSLWGDVPYIDVADIDYATSGLPRDDVSKIRKIMIEELKEWGDHLPATSADDYKGRPTKWAAKMQLCKYYLWEKNWTELSKLCEEIITQSPHGLVNEYADLWGLENEYNKEFIWEFDYVQSIFSQCKSSWMHPRGADEKSSDSALSGIFTGFGKIVAMDEFIDSFEKTDKRREWYIWLEDDPRVDFKYNYVTKFLDKPENVLRGNSGINLPQFRMADAWLMQAEAENELNNGPNAKAYDRINKIRERAGLEPLANCTKEQFHNVLMNERKWELGFEGHRRLDLCRWGKLVEAVQSVAGTNPMGANLVKAHHMLLPIPTKEINQNPNLIQNPGYTSN